ncbi:MAG: tetratricopeptide repeat protein [Calditrichia bacterium]
MKENNVTGMVLKIVQQMILILIILGASNLHAQEPRTRFSKANQSYAQGDYQNAIELYSKILKQGIESGEVYFNLGNAYYKTNNMGRAILYYEKARKFIEGDPALEQNLKLTQLKIVDKIEPIPELFIIEWWSKLTRVFSLETLLWLSFSIFSILITLIILQILYTRQFLRRIIWVTTVLFVLIFVITFSQIYEFETWQFGVILEEKVSVVSEPGIGGTEVFILHEGTKVKVNRMLNDWLEISIPDGKTGWLRETSLEVI